MKIVRAKDLKFIPASHEDPDNPCVWKKILVQKEDLVPGRVQMVNWAKIPPKRTFRAHYHEDMEEIFILLSGKARVLVENKEAILERGDAVVIPIGSVHKMENLSLKEDVEYVVIGISQERGGKTVVVDEK